jgi:hypothetical protein
MIGYELTDCLFSKSISWAIDLKDIRNNKVISTFISLNSSKKRRKKNELRREENKKENEIVF